MNTDEILKSIAKDLGIENSSPEEQQTIIMGLGQRAVEASTLGILEALPEAKRDEYMAIAKSADEEKLNYFLKNNIPDYQKIIKSEMDKIVADFKRIKASLS